MKKIIDGRRYDTDTAKMLGSDSFGARNDFSFWEEELYRKNTGEYFLHGYGGPMTRYAEAVDNNSWTWGERIFPLTIDAARKWAEDHLNADEYEKIFEVTEDSKKTVTFSLPEDAIEKIKQISGETRRPMSEILAEIIRKYRP